MKILFSVPSGYHLRELLLPLRPYLEADTDIKSVHVVTPAAPMHEDVFPGFSVKNFFYHDNPHDVESHKKLLREIAPNIVVTNTVGHDPLDYPILESAARLNIPSLTFIASWDNVWKIERLIANDVPVRIANSLIVWNGMMRAHVLRLFPDIAPQRISVIGAPRLDYLWRSEEIPSKKETYKLLGFTDTSKPLIHFSTTELYPMDYVVAAVAEAISRRELPEAHLYASVHPGGDLKRHKRLEVFGTIVKYSPGRVEKPVHPSFAYNPTLSDVMNLVGTFKHAAVLINQSSTTALESLIANVPVINVKYGRPLDWWRWYRSMVYRDFKQHYIDLIRDNATYQVKNTKQLIQSLNQALRNPHAKSSEAKRTIQRMITTTDGTASKKVLTDIKKRAKKS